MQSTEQSVAVPPASRVSQSRYTLALIGNPNTGKTTLFNALTGLSQRIGNYPGVTVERKLGSMSLDDIPVDLIDLPGTYSLAARSPDEIIAVDVLLGQQQGASRVDAVLAILDASNLDRNFYLLSQILELNLPVIVALNMIDVASEKGVHIQTEKLTAALGARVIPVCASKGNGLPELRQALKATLLGKTPPRGMLPDFSPALKAEVQALHQELRAQAPRLKRAVHEIEAFRVLVDAGGYAERRLVAALDPDFARSLAEHRQRASGTAFQAVKKHGQDARATLSAEEVRIRYAWTKSVLDATVRRPERPPETSSDRADKILTHWFSGTLIFAALMLGMFQAIFTGARPIMDWISGGMDAAAAYAGQHMPPGALTSLLCDGVIHGAGAVLVFLPQICILFLFLGLLEDCGYMSRAAFLMDRFLAPAGLSGKCFIPMLSSFACTVPGIMATRTIENRRDRLLTMLIAPLMSCSARLPVYTIMIAAFVPDTSYAHGWIGLRGITLLSMYLLGIFLAVPIAWILRKTALRGDDPPFLIELPSYKAPGARTVALRVYESAKAFVVRAGTLILAVSVVIWALSYFPHSKDIGQRYAAQRTAVQASTADEAARAEQLSALEREESGAYLRSSYLATMGRAITPAFTPLGWDWRISMSVLAALPAREIVVATLGTIFNVESEHETGLQKALQDAKREDGRPLFSLPVALSIMVFFALCSQCAATLAVIRRESNSWRWPLFTFAYLTILAYGGALLTYQVAMALN
ncbi:MAG TPA: ferrous iron transport protein B [Planctomycetota bacterium]|jgi:ferrous iron transport protein B